MDNDTKIKVRKNLKRTCKINLKMYSKMGFILIILIVSSFAILMTTPVIPNLIGKSLDEKVYQDSLENIEKNRKGMIKIRIVDDFGDPISGYNITVNQTDHEFLFGAMFFHYDPEEEPEFSVEYAEKWNKLFNFALLPFYYSSWENETYMPEESRINKTIEYCHEHNITMKGHPLVWNFEAGIPEWLNIDNMTDDEIRDHFKNRIYSLTQKYANNITYWDVTNEFVQRGAIGGLNTEDFMDECFTWAREAVPTNHLIINDYGMMGHSFGYSDTARMYEKLNKRGTPYDIIGMQTHAMDTDWIPTYEVWQTLEGFSRLNKPIHITEFMVTSKSVPITNSWQKGLWNEENQAEYLKRLYTTAFSHPSCESIAYWGFEDRSNPEKNEGYGLVNNDLSPKLVYETLDQLINHDWHTELTNLTTNSDGWVEFQGFYGDYDISGHNLTTIIETSKTSENQFFFEI